jgi:hypothetical protein
MTVCALPTPPERELARSRVLLLDVRTAGVGIRLLIRDGKRGAAGTSRPSAAATLVRVRLMAPPLASARPHGGGMAYLQPGSSTVWPAGGTWRQDRSGPCCCSRARSPGRQRPVPPRWEEQPRQGWMRAPCAACDHLLGKRRRSWVRSAAPGPRLADPRVGRTDHDHLRDMRLEHPRDLPRVAGHLKRAPIIRAQAPCEQSSASGLVSTRPADRTSPPSAIATAQKSRCTSNPIALTPAPFTRQTDGRTGGQTTPTGPRSQRNGTRGRGGHRKARAQTPIVQEPACPTCVPPGSPCPGARP